MKATITQTRKPHRSDRRSAGRSIIYVESPLDNVADRWFEGNKIRELSFKCKTWSKVSRMTTKPTAVALKELFPEALSITFSSKAGCKCGCSPGYIMKHPANQYGNNFWVKVEASDSEIETFAKSINTNQIIKALEKEIELNLVLA